MSALILDSRESFLARCYASSMSAEDAAEMWAVVVEDEGAAIRERIEARVAGLARTRPRCVLRLVVS